MEIKKERNRATRCVEERKTKKQIEWRWPKTAKHEIGRDFDRMD